MTTEAKRPTKPGANRPPSSTVVPAPVRSGFVAHVARWAGLSVVQFVLVEYIVSATWRGLYSYRNNYISELGVPFCGPTGNWPCSQLYVLLNASMVLFGVAIAAVGGSWYIVRRIDGRAASFFIVAGAGAITAGVVNQGVNYPIHSFGATAFFVFGNFGLVIAGGHRSLRRSIRIVVTALGAVGLAGYFAYMSGHEFGLGIGSMERIATYALLVGIVVLSVSQFNATRVPKNVDETA
ncbi:DUF998 domain-containing protein [Rhodococcus sp. IEGM 1330]|uniref:DUF998 domain-containing protein n=1 Tax=Rhodococcus sp. IEGM 1330 TaxID=3082225 RepID=UPI002952D6B3|nr:DUF998 domain-containing protein [Rhodococcus sp. IEGM 1330]MDV8023466.1 DUF998 domain-containing protein [Rhodococcus sp. IEGM 1330]